MIKVRLHIDSDNVFMDERIFFDTELPFIFPKGTIIYGLKDIKNKLEEKIKSDLDIANDYLKYFYYGSHNIEKATTESLKDFSLIDCNFIVDYCYDMDDNIVHVSIGS